MVQGLEVLVRGMHRALRHILPTGLAPAQLVRRQITLPGNPSLLFDIFLLTHALGHIRMRPVREPVHNFLPLRRNPPQLLFHLAPPLAQFLPLLPSCIGIALTELCQFLLLPVQPVDPTLQLPPRPVQFQPAVNIGLLRIHLPHPNRLAHSVRVRSNSFGINHNIHPQYWLILCPILLPI